MVETEDGHEIETIFFDGPSDRLIVIGTGFANELERVAPLIHMFSRDKRVIFNYRGHGHNQPNILDQALDGLHARSRLREKLIKIYPFIDKSKIPRVNLEKTTFGLHEHKDVTAVVKHFKKLLSPRQTCGIGLCFSAYTFAKALSLEPTLVDKLILDSSYNSPQRLVYRIVRNPKLFFDPQRGSWLSLLKTVPPDTEGYGEAMRILSQPSFTREISLHLRQFFSRHSVARKKTSDYLAKIENTSILFLHGKMDQLNPYKQECLTNYRKAKTEQKAIVSFPNGRHLTSSIKSKELYKPICNLFLDLPFDKFIEHLQSPQKFVKFELDRIKKKVINLITKEYTDEKTIRTFDNIGICQPFRSASER